MTGCSNYERSILGFSSPLTQQHSYRHQGSKLVEKQTHTLVVTFDDLLQKFGSGGSISGGTSRLLMTCTTPLLPIMLVSVTVAFAPILISP